MIRSGENSVGPQQRALRSQEIDFVPGVAQRVSQWRLIQPVQRGAQVLEAW